MTTNQRSSWTSPLDSPCAMEHYQRAMGYQVDPWDLDDCVECELDGGCVTHLCYRNEKSAALHLDWFMPFASPGETECGHVGGPRHLVPSEYRPRPCQLPDQHKGRHRSRMGWSWPATRKTASR